MMLLLILSLSLSGGYCKDLWSQQPPKISNIILEKNKPITIQNEEDVTLANLNGTFYADSLSQLKVTGLCVQFNHLEKIEPGSICSSPSLRRIEVYFGPNTGISITKDILKNCENLQELSLIGDPEKPQNIDLDALEGLSNLKNLNLIQLDINHVKRGYFKNLHSLEYLTLRKCFINKIDDDAFTDLGNLKDLEIFYNSNLTHIPKNLFKNAEKLERLFLRENNITKLTWDEFEGLSSLKTLLIGANWITSFDAEKIAKNIPNLKDFSFEMNQVDCKPREAFANELRSKLKHPIEITHKFDPGFYDSCEDERDI